MIDPDEQKTIRFSADDVPELPEIDRQQREADEERRRQQAEEDLEWLEQNMGFHPFGGSGDLGIIKRDFQAKEKKSGPTVLVPLVRLIVCRCNDTTEA